MLLEDDDTAAAAVVVVGAATAALKSDCTGNDQHQHFYYCCCYVLMWMNSEARVEAALLFSDVTANHVAAGRKPSEPLNLCSTTLVTDLESLNCQQGWPTPSFLLD